MNYFLHNIKSFYFTICGKIFFFKKVVPFGKPICKNIIYKFFTSESDLLNILYTSITATQSRYIMCYYYYCFFKF